MRVYAASLTLPYATQLSGHAVPIRGAGTAMGLNGIYYVFRNRICSYVYVRTLDIYRLAFKHSNITVCTILAPVAGVESMHAAVREPRMALVVRATEAEQYEDHILHAKPGRGVVKNGVQVSVESLYGDMRPVC